jgi:putative hydrolase of HD superfamily
MALDPFTDIDDPEFGRRNGKDLKTCDLLGAFMEASISRRYGVSSSSLRLGEEGIREKLLSRHNGIDTARIIDGLDSLDI